MNNQPGDLENDYNSKVKLINALTGAAPYSHPIKPVRLVETHISWVLLTGEFAYKIKKPVSFGFLDFSTLEKRRFFCHEEIRLNRRLAAEIYLEVVSITGPPAAPVIGGTKEVIEYAVKMKQFSEGVLLSELAGSKQLSADEIDQIADILADFHQQVEPAEQASSYGNAADIKHWFDENFEQIKPLLRDLHNPQQLNAIQLWGGREWHRRTELMELRKQQGFVRECHGDLHLSNMTLIDGKVTLFDCIEFNPMLRWIDVVSEVAFLMIDLCYFGYQNYAFRFLNRYLQHTGDYQSLGVLRYYLVYRAMVLAKVALLRMQQCRDSESRLAQKKFTAFMNLAEKFSEQSGPVLIITHGFSGSGKSTFAGLLSEAVGALQLRSDIERKRRFGYSAHEKTKSAVDGDIYSPEASRQTYRDLADMAKPVLEAGFPVIVDATFLKIEQRALFRNLAAACNIPFIILDVIVSRQELARRVQSRKNDASEATIEILQHQLRSAQPLTPKEAEHVVNIDCDQCRALADCLFRIAQLRTNTGL